MIGTHTAVASNVERTDLDRPMLEDVAPDFAKQEAASGLAKIEELEEKEKKMEEWIAQVQMEGKDWMVKMEVKEEEEEERQQLQQHQPHPWLRWRAEQEVRREQQHGLRAAAAAAAAAVRDGRRFVRVLKSGSVKVLE